MPGSIHCFGMEQVAHFRVSGKERERRKELEDLFLSKDCLCLEMSY